MSFMNNVPISKTPVFVGMIFDCEYSDNLLTAPFSRAEVIEFIFPKDICAFFIVDLSAFILTK